MDNFPVALLMTVLALALVLALAWIILRAVAAAGLGKSRGGRLRVLESLPLGPRERLVLVRHDDHEYLVGVSAGNVSLLEKKPGRPSSTDPA